MSQQPVENVEEANEASFDSKKITNASSQNEQKSEICGSQINFDEHIDEAKFINYPLTPHLTIFD
jgi:hypothetical protein